MSHAAPEGLMYTGENEDDLLENENFNQIVRIQFGYPLTIENEIAGVDIAFSGNDVLVNSTASNVQYELSGTSPNGSIKIYSDKKFQLTLNNLSLTSTLGAPINIQSKKRAFIHLKSNTQNFLKDASVYMNIGENEDLKAAFFSEGKLIFNGTGSLEVQANYKHAICSDDYIKFREGNYIISKAASDAIHANDFVIIDNGNFTIRADSDGIEASKGHIIINNGVFDIEVGDDGIAASYKDDDAIIPYVIIHNGEFTIKTLEGEGIESKAELYIHNGKFNIDAYDDAINAHTLLIINNGRHFFKSETNDGIDANKEIIINGGEIIAFGAESPEGGIDNDSQPFYINGGVIIGAGGRNSSPKSNTTTQPVINITVNGISQKLAFVQDNQLLSAITIPVNTKSLIYSDSRLQLGKTLQVYKDVQIENSSNEWGWHYDGWVSGGYKFFDIELNNKVKYLN